MSNCFVLDFHLVYVLLLRGFFARPFVCRMGAHRPKTFSFVFEISIYVPYENFYLLCSNPCFAIFIMTILFFIHFLSNSNRMLHFTNYLLNGSKQKTKLALSIGINKLKTFVFLFHIILIDFTFIICFTLKMENFFTSNFFFFSIFLSRYSNGKLLVCLWQKTWYVL